jgi:hypothetical protein
VIKRRPSASPVCYADEVDSAYMWAQVEKKKPAAKKPPAKGRRKKKAGKKT